MFVPIKPETICGLINWKLSSFPSIIATLQQTHPHEEPVFPPVQSTLISQLSKETETGTTARVLKMTHDFVVILDIIIELNEIYEIQICANLLRIKSYVIARDLVQWDLVSNLLIPSGAPAPQLGVVENVRT